MSKRATRSKRVTESDSEWIACPLCGEMHGELWDYDWRMREDVETECGSCGGKFTLTRTVSVSYRATAEAP